ncbi:hypothetical protein [Komarekiella delphini-convector]|uniref:hypothetical protein n=1 Tax=Komarekiella delphini-convector TaxID=3050158 RepID=UPI00178168C5|nr:hypothetical protein [Komarekiella delphini-convector]
MAEALKTLLQQQAFIDLLTEFPPLEENLVLRTATTEIQGSIIVSEKRSLILKW